MVEDEFQNACANILFHLVRGYCIKEDHGELPPKSFFLDNIFENRTYFPEDKLMEVTKKLGIAELSTSGGDSHDVHAHRHRRSLDDRGNSVVFKHGISRRSTDEHGHAENTSYEGKVSEWGPGRVDVYTGYTCMWRQIMISWSDLWHPTQSPRFNPQQDRGLNYCLGTLACLKILKFYGRMILIVYINALVRLQKEHNRKES